MSDVREACVDGVRVLSAWASRLRLEDIPRAVLERAIRVLADDLAAIIGARGEPEVERVHARMLGRAKVPEATIFRGGRPRTDRLSAAVANGIAADWLELDEGYRLAPCHAGLYTVPALLAECEANDVALGDMLRALVVGYEVATRIARTWVPSAFVMQSHGRYAAVGAAAAIARARNADEGLFRSAITGAVTLITAAPRDHLVSGALVRNVWPAVGAWAGTMSVEWAECGIGGVDSGFYDVYSTVHGGTAHPARLTAQLGENWAILDGYMKMYACCQHLHSTVEALLDLGEVATDDIESITVETHPLALPLMNARPATTLGAKFSLPHAVGAALVQRTGGADAFMSTTLDDPRIGRLRELVRVAAYAPLPDAPNDRPARVSINYRDGRRLDAECLSAQGGSDRPFPPEMFIQKITALTRGVYPQFVPVFERLLRADAASLVQPWPALVAQITRA